MNLFALDQTKKAKHYANKGRRELHVLIFLVHSFLVQCAVPALSNKSAKYLFFIMGVFRLALLVWLSLSFLAVRCENEPAFIVPTQQPFSYRMNRPFGGAVERANADRPSDGSFYYIDLGPVEDRESIESLSFENFALVFTLTFISQIMSTFFGGFYIAVSLYQK